MVTMKDIAMIVGVSRQAVSSVLNGNSSCRVSKAKACEIKRVAYELNYVSNNAARILKGAPTKTIGFMVPAMDSKLNSALISEMSEMLSAEGYNILFNDYSSSKYDVTKSLLKLLAHGVDGIIIYSSEDVRDFDEKQTVPYLFFSHNNYKRMDVGVDNEYGGYLATQHLLGHGHEKVAYMSINSYDGQTDKKKGWRRAHEEKGTCVDDRDTIVLRELDGRADAIINVIKQRNINAIFASNDFIGAKLITVLMEHGIRVPDDLAVIGYDGYTFCEFCSPSLTTIIQPLRAQAEAGVKLLLERIANKELHSPAAGFLIKPVLYPGGSCGCHPSPIDNLYRINSFSMLEKDAKMNFNINILSNQGEK